MKLIVGFMLIIMHISFTRTFHLNNANKYSELTIQERSSPDGENLNSYNNSSNVEEMTDEKDISDKANIEEAIKQEIDRLARDIIELFYKFYKQLMDSDSDANENAPEFNPNDSFRPPNATDILEFLKKEVRELREAIKGLKNSVEISESIKIRLALLEKAMEQFQRLLDDQNAQLILKLQELAKFLEVFTSAINEIKERVDKLEQHIKEWQAGGATSLQSEIIIDVIARDYQSALKKLPELKGELKKNINYIIHEVYNNKAGNFDLVHQFGDASKNTTISLAIYEALKFEMESNNNKNYLQIFRLINSLKRKLINNSSAPANERKEAETMKNTLHSEVKDIIFFKLIEALPAENNYKKLAELSDKIYMNYPVLFSEVIGQAIKQTFEKIKAQNLILFFADYRYQTQSVFVYTSLFNELKGRNKLDESTVVTLAFGLKKALDSTVDSNAYTEGNKVKNALPNSVRNLAFSNRVCFRNIRNNEYMYAAIDGYKYDSNRRQIFSWVPGNRVNNGLWIVERVKGKYLIKNTLFNEYLYTAVNDFNYNNKRRRVFTWVPGPVDDQFYWIFEPRGNNMYIKSAYYNEYLLADDEEKFSEDRRYVFTWRPETKTGDSLWEVENCY